MSKPQNDPKTSSDAEKSAPNGMDQVLSQTLSMDAHQFPSADFNLISNLTGDDPLDDSLWHTLGLVSSSTTGQVPPPSLLDQFPLSSFGRAIPPSSLPLLRPTASASVLGLGVAAPETIRVERDDVGDRGGIVNWLKHPSQVPGYNEGRDYDLLALIKASKYPKPAKPYLLLDKNRKSELPLTKPALDPTGSSGMVIVGTANRNARKHVVLALDTTFLHRGANPDPDSLLRGMALIRSHAREVHWISERSIVVAHGSEATIFDIDDQFQMTEKSKLNWVHTDEIREISFDPKQSSVFAAGGFDRVLSINDLTRGMTALSAVRLDDVIGSVRWGTFDHNSVTATTDDGRFFQFDPRTAMRKASLFVDAQKLHLYSHCMFDPNTLLLGFGDGEILQVDIRKSMFCQGARDPIVHSIGDMIYHQESQSFLFSGISDFSVWRLDTSKATAFAWSRPVMTTTAATYYCHAIFGRNSDTVIKTNELGAIGVYRHVHPVQLYKI